MEFRIETFRNFKSGILSSKHDDAYLNSTEFSAKTVDEQDGSPIDQNKAMMFREILKDYLQKLEFLKALDPSSITKKKEDVGGAYGKRRPGSETAKFEAFQKDLERVLAETVNELESKGTFTALLTYIHKYEQKSEETNILKQKYNQEAKRLEKLKRDYQQQVQQSEKETQEMNEKIEVLKETQMELKQLCNQRQKYVKKQHYANEVYLAEVLKNDENQRRKDIDTLKHLIEHEKTSHKYAMDFLQWQREQLEQELEQLSQKYDKDIAEKTAELDQMKKRKAETNDKYEDLQMEFDNISKMVEEERAARKRADEARRLHRAQIRAAKCIQKWYRAVRAAKKAKKAAKKKNKKQK